MDVRTVGTPLSFVGKRHCFSVYGGGEAISTLPMASKYEAKKDTCDSSRPNAVQADVVAIRLEVDDLCTLPPSVQELAFNSSPAEMQESSANAPETPTTSTCFLHRVTT